MQSDQRKLKKSGTPRGCLFEQQIPQKSHERAGNAGNGRAAGGRDVGMVRGSPVNHHGKHYLIDDVQFLPRPVQRPGVPVWAAGYHGNIKPLRRAARYDGFFPVGLENVDQFAQAVAAVRDLRADNSAPYDIAVELLPGSDVAPYAEAGATWWMTGIEPGVSLSEVRGVLAEGPVG